MKNSIKTLLFFSFVFLLTVPIFAQRQHPKRPTPSGGVLMYEQAAYDVQSYDITAQIFPESKSLKGETIIKAKMISPTNWFVFDLDTPYEISSVRSMEADEIKKLEFKRDGEKIWAKFPLTKQTGEDISIKISYSGKPRIAPNPPWVGGFMWKKTADGSDWIVNANQNDGADLWYPIKDHPSDEPNEVYLHITVPENLYVATVGRLQDVENNSDKTKTFHWKMSQSINNYNVVLNIAPYKIIERKYTSIDGTTFPIQFYALPESVEKAKDIVDQTEKFLAFYEKYLGPYPYRAEKLGIAETPHLGMEHSTIIAYGNKFRKDNSGFDWLMLHELGHEWWGNMVTASDWRDMWIHEGFQAFMDTLYVEETKGKDAYFAAMKNRVKNLKNKKPTAPREPQFAYQIYYLPPDYTQSDGDIYGKGALILHTLRYLIGDDAFFRGLRRMAYPDKKMEKIKDGGQNRFATTDDVKQIFEEESKMDLDWFFEVYLRQPQLPLLVSSPIVNDEIQLTWETPNNLPFPMPVDMEINGQTKRIVMKNGKAKVKMNGDTNLITDKQGWILKSDGNLNITLK